MKNDVIVFLTIFLATTLLTIILTGIYYAYVFTRFIKEKEREEKEKMEFYDISHIEVSEK